MHYHTTKLTSSEQRHHRLVPSSPEKHKVAELFYSNRSLSPFSSAPVLLYQLRQHLAFSAAFHLNANTIMHQKKMLGTMKFSREGFCRCAAGGEIHWHRDIVLCQHWRMSRTMYCRASKFVCLHGGSFEMKGKNVDKNNVDVDIGVQLWRPIHSRILHSKYRPREPNLSCTYWAWHGRNLHAV